MHRHGGGKPAHGSEEQACARYRRNTFLRIPLRIGLQHGHQASRHTNTGHTSPHRQHQHIGRQGADRETGRSYQRQCCLHAARALQIKRKPNRQLRHGVACEKTSCEQAKLRRRQAKFKRKERPNHRDQRPIRLVDEIDGRKRQGDAGEKRHRLSMARLPRPAHRRAQGRRSRTEIGQ